MHLRWRVCSMQVEYSYRHLYRFGLGGGGLILGVCFLVYPIYQITHLPAGGKMSRKNLSKLTLALLVFSGSCESEQVCSIDPGVLPCHLEVSISALPAQSLMAKEADTQFRCRLRSARTASTKPVPGLVCRAGRWRASGPGG